MTKRRPHADLIAEVYMQACVDAVNAAQRRDIGARHRFHAVTDALQAAYPREVRAVHDKAAGAVGEEAPREPKP
jgi:hypothetical protein